MTLKRFGGDPKFDEYVKTTPILLPTIGSCVRWAKGVASQVSAGAGAGEL